MALENNAQHRVLVSSVLLTFDVMLFTLAISIAFFTRKKSRVGLSATGWQAAALARQPVADRSPITASENADLWIAVDNRLEAFSSRIALIIKQI